MRGSMLKEILQEQGISISELARRLNVSAQTLYSMVKRDNQKVDFDMMMHICKQLDVPVERLCEDAVLPRMPDLREWQFIGKYRRLSDSGKELVDMVIDHELRHREKASAQQPKESRIIPLYLSPAAAGYASPALGDDYEDYTVDKNSEADFAVRIDGDSMEPVIHDGDAVLVRRDRVENGDVGMFFVDGDMKCKQYCRDNFGNVYLLSLNRDRADADVSVPASSGITLCCFGKVLLDRRPVLP